MAVDGVGDESRSGCGSLGGDDCGKVMGGEEEGWKGQVVIGLEEKTVRRGGGVMGTGRNEEGLYEQERWWGLR